MIDCTELLQYIKFKVNPKNNLSTNLFYINYIRTNNMFNSPPNVRIDVCR